MRQAIIWTNCSLTYWYHVASLVHNALKIPHIRYACFGRFATKRHFHNESIFISIVAPTDNSGGVTTCRSAISSLALESQSTVYTCENLSQQWRLQATGIIENDHPSWQMLHWQWHLIKRNNTDMTAPKCPRAVYHRWLLSCMQPRQEVGY